MLTRRRLFARAGAAVLAAGLPDVAFAAGPERRFVSRPDLRPPVLTVLRRPAAASGLVFLAPSSGPGQHGAMIVDERGELVWFRPAAHGVVTDFKVQRLHGEPVLTWWQGKVVAGLGAGEWVVVDASYRERARFSTARGLAGDLHEFQISPWNTALVTSNEVRTWDLRSVRGSAHGHVVGGVVQELALPGGRLLWEWRSLDHVPVAETAIRAKPGPRFDYFHVNGIDVAPDGNLIVSARNTWAAYKVARHTGKVLWRLGGKQSDFVLGPGVRFEWQHDVRQHPGGLLTVFDNAAAPQEGPQSRALLLRLDERRRRATLVRAFVHRPPVLSHFMGNAQLLAGGGVFVGWGGSRYVTEFDAAGRVVFDAQLPAGGQSYRAFRLPWVGRPSEAPAAVARAGALYVSWNGATEVASWRLEEDGRATRTVARAGFETALPLSGGTASARAIALDRAGNELGASPAVRA